MNKKFLSAILFGAMLATSAGTFVSCKDYDDDIKGLQTQIDTNKNAIAELQKLVGSGNWVTSVAASGENLVVTMSNGTTATIAGIKGADGKDGKDAAEWTISEDGFWCKDGEKTSNVAVAQNGKDGKDGVTAPSPTIGADGNWVVYSWDAAKGEFVAEATEIPAAGTAAYAVEANGVYTLYIADENGEYQEIVLPATCDSFVMTAPYANIEVAVEHAVWGKAGRDAKEYAALLKAFPEIADHKTNDKLIQGGELPVLVNPMNLELDDNYTFQLVDVKGKVADIELANPTKGIAADWKIENGKMSRSAEEGGLWTLEVAPQFDRKEGYGNIANGSLVATNAKGVSSRTAFAYNVAKKAQANGNVVVTGTSLTVDYAEEGIDVLAAVYGTAKNQAIFTLTNEYYGKYILEATNALQVEKYGLTTEGSKLYIANMPENETSIQVALKMTALGLNGSTDASPVITITVQQTIEASEGLTPMTVTLDKKVQKVRWNIEELGLSAVEMDKFLKTGNVSNDVKFFVTREADKLYKETGADAVKGQDGETESYYTYYDPVRFYDAKGNVLTYAGDGVWKNSSDKEAEVATFGFDVDADATVSATAQAFGHKKEMWNADTYKVSLTSKNGNVVIFSAETELTVENPEVDATFVKLVPAFVKDGVYQITGLVSGGYVTYGIDNALITNNGADAVSYIDMDYAEYVENGGDDEEDYAYYNWIPFNTDGTIKTAANAQVVVNTWAYEPEDLTESVWVKALNNQLYETRNIRAMISLFGNAENVVPFDFQIVVKSELYSEDASSVTVDATKLMGTFTDTNAAANVDTRNIDLSKAFTAKVVAGQETGKAYSLFAKRGSATTNTTYSYDYTNYTKAGQYVADYSGNLIPFSIVNYSKLCELLGVPTQNDILTGEKVYNLVAADWDRLWAEKSVYFNNGDLSKKLTKTRLAVLDKDWNIVYEDEAKTKIKFEETATVKFYKVAKNENGNYEFVLDADGNKIPTSGQVYTALHNAAAVNYSGEKGMTVDQAAALYEMTVIPARDQKWHELFDAYCSTVSAKKTPSTTAGPNSGTATRDGRIASVKFVFDDAEEGAKYFNNAIADNAYAEDAILTVNPAAQVDVVGGKVIVGMKLKITDVWGMEMVVPFNVEISTK